MNERQQRISDAVRAVLGANVRIKVYLEKSALQYVVFVDAQDVGRKGSMMVRCTRFLPLDYSDDALRDVVAALARGVNEATGSAGLIGVRF